METFLRILHTLNLLTPPSRIKLELLTLSRIARELDDCSLRAEILRAHFPEGPSITTRIVNASMQVKVAAGNLKVIDAERFS